MKIALRADASLQIGTGHIMRCLTLADALRERGADCHFLCRAHEGNLIEFIRTKGHSIHALPLAPTAAGFPANDSDNVAPAHHLWLGATQAQDIDACATILATLRPDWLVVDHYALDARWERTLAPHYRKLLVIDDLADRPHACNLLLDQTFGRDAADYRPLVPADCRLLCGSQYALLRPEFAALRHYSLQRRAHPALHELLVTMGGVDKDNATEQVLQALRTSSLPADCRINVIMGATAPWLNEVRKQAEDMPWQTQVLVGVSNMAQRMADSDLAIGAAGATSWERCCLGVPTIMLMLADNQMKIAQGLVHLGAARLIAPTQNIPTQFNKLLSSLIDDLAHLQHMSRSAAGIVDGTGIGTVLQEMEI